MPDESSTSTSSAPDAATKRPFWRRAARLLLIFVAVPYVGVALLLMFNQRKLIYHPTRSQPLHVADFGAGVDVARDVTLTTDDGLTLHGWLIQADPQTTDPPLVIYFPGNAANRANRIHDLQEVASMGCEVLIFDYRGYAENPGSPSEATMTADAHAIWSYAVDELHQSADRIVLFGESLGGAVAISLATGLCRDGTQPAGVITQATFDSVPSLARELYPMFPFERMVWDRWNSVDRIGEITCPILMFHGTADTIVPIHHGRRLFAAAPPTSASGIEKSFVEIAGVDHNNIPVSTLREQMLALLSTIKRSIPPADP